MLDAAVAEPLDEGTQHFQPSNLQVTTVDVGNPATNVIPNVARATFNVRFNDRHTGDSLAAWLKETFDVAFAEMGKGGAYDLEIKVSGEAFLTEPGPLSDAVAAAVEAETGRRPELSTSGGTSDARFIKDHCPVVEFGAIGKTMHKADERMAVKDLVRLSRIYERVLERVLGAGR
jgi:succinyl-diaminopimelate desuccinylase